MDDLIIIDDILSKAQLNILVQIFISQDDEHKEKMERTILDEIKRSDEFNEIELENDIYCIGFVTFLKADGPKRLNKVVQKCVWTFVFQLLLLGLLAYGFAVEKGPEGQQWKGLLEDIYAGDPSLNMARIVCAFLLHISVLPEVRSAKMMLSFAKKNVTSFSG